MYMRLGAGFLHFGTHNVNDGAVAVFDDPDDALALWYRTGLAAKPLGPFAELFDRTNRKFRFREALKQVCAARIYRNAPLGDENVNGFARRADGAYAVLDHRDARAGEVGRDDGHLRSSRSVAVTARPPP